MHHSLELYYRYEIHSFTEGPRFESQTILNLKKEELNLHFFEDRFEDHTVKRLFLKKANCILADCQKAVCSLAVCKKAAISKRLNEKKFYLFLFTCSIVIL